MPRLLQLFKNLRVLLLLGFLIFITLLTTHQIVYTRNWSSTLQAVILPINADGHLNTNDYIKSLTTADFSQIDRWLRREAAKFDLPLTEPVQVVLGEQIKTLPPEFPVDPTPVGVMFWGLRFRWWAYRNTPDDSGSLTRVRIFVMYHEGNSDKPLAHSLGLQKGLLGLVHAYALDSQTKQNNIVIAHEMLHTVGAVDKYEAWGNPIYPVGYANSNRNPLFPQRSAEIMAGRIPTSFGSSYMAESLKSVVINRHTAREINWIR